MLASGGHPNPPIWSRVLWALMEGAIAIALLMAGGLTALQAVSLVTALPFSIVLLLVCVSTLKAFGMEAATAAIERAARYRAVGEHLADDFDEYLGEKVDERIDYRLKSSQGLLGKQREVFFPRQQARACVRFRPGRRRHLRTLSPDPHRGGSAGNVPDLHIEARLAEAYPTTADHGRAVSSFTGHARGGHPRRRARRWDLLPWAGRNE